MNSESKILLTKDECPCGYLPTYGNKHFKTPNIDELAQKGTVFLNHHTAAASTAMSFMSMITGKFCHELDNDSMWQLQNRYYNGITMFDKARELGYECHVLWDITYDTQFHLRERFINYGDKTIFHFGKLKQGVGAHYRHRGLLKRDLSKTEAVYEYLDRTLNEITSTENKIFLWIHLPQVINGFTGCGEDVESFDEIVGIVRRFFDDSSIFISADHGEMQGQKGKYGYGYDVYEPVICIPLVTPRVENQPFVNRLTSNVDMFELLFQGRIIDREIIYSDTQFYAQPLRKLAIISGKYKYIYNKKTKTTELYDLEWDPTELHNLSDAYFYDKERCIWEPLSESYYYPYWNEINCVKDSFEKERKKIWKRGRWYREFFLYSINFVNMHGLKRWKRRIK